ncbi:diacylglycerol kinase family protein [Niastella caeni]|uniref:Diacylglycerol kinase family protein n=1 Tax=Niastella caeni TaxID=2569763 RepID=A0A4S8HVW9_9BACT|nr:diacylglycerol kinase family protein [Niastella caeni]THU37302.1 diacylglycerol kinase family protein [Niastella caeni]
MKSQEFSFRSRIKSFRFAMEGIGSFFQREHNAWLHFMATIAVITLTALVGVTKNELLALVFAIGFVWVAEMFNTCIERVMDFVSDQRHAEIKFIKDLAAGAVLVSAVTALAVGAIVFIPKLF